jgi:hypothetical protein
MQLRSGKILKVVEQNKDVTQLQSELHIYNKINQYIYNKINQYVEKINETKNSWYGKLLYIFIIYIFK